MIDTLLAPISADAPCGPDLEYDADFLALLRSAAGKPEEQYGDTLIAAQPPAWRDVERIALALLARTKDLRVVVPLTYAWIDSRGLEGYADALRLTSSLLDAYWEPLYPLLAVDGTPDPLPRFNVLAELAGPQGCARAAREQPLLGVLSVSAAVNVLQQGEGADGGYGDGDTYAGGRERLVREWRDAFESGSPALHAGLTVGEQLAHLRRIVSERLGYAWTLDASALEQQLATLVAALPSGRATQATQDATPEAAGHEPQSTSQQRGAARPAAANGAAWRDAEISSRADIDFGLEKMCRYFELHEPSHPAPLFLRRAQRLLSLNFYEIFRDIAPESVRELDHLSGHRNESAQ